MLLPLLLMVSSLVPAQTEGRYDAVGALGFAPGLFSAHEWHCAATLVRPDVALTARHCVEYTATFAVRFRRDEEGGVGSIESAPSSFQNIEVTGIYLPSSGAVALLFLYSAPVGISPLPMTFRAADTEPVTIAGWGREGPSIGEGQRRELRTCESAITTIGGYGDLFFPSAWDPGPGCGPNSNDSGGPLIAENERGGPHVIGVVLGASNADPLDIYSSDPIFNPQQFTRR